MVWSLAYLGVRNLFALVWLLARPRRSKELEILVLRHEVAMLRRQGRQPKLTPADRGLLAALSRSLPRAAWAGFTVEPETLLRWHLWGAFIRFRLQIGMLGAATRFLTPTASDSRVRVQSWSRDAT